jgi:uncharacterized membrane protein YfcA
MRKLILEMSVFVAMVLVAIGFFGYSIWDVIKELLWFYGVIFVIATVLAVWIGISLTRAMNPKIERKDLKDGVSKVE